MNAFNPTPNALRPTPNALRPKPQAQRPTPQAQRPKPQAQLHDKWCLDFSRGFDKNLYMQDKFDKECPEY